MVMALAQRQPVGRVEPRPLTTVVHPPRIATSSCLPRHLDRIKLVGRAEGADGRYSFQATAEVPPRAQLTA